MILDIGFWILDDLIISIKQKQEEMIPPVSYNPFKDIIL
jgi:hypothetical protein